MKTLKALFFLSLIAFAGCNSSSASAPDPSVSTLQSQVHDLTLALAAATHEQAIQFAKIQLKGPTGSIPSSSFTRGVSAVDFGPCPDGGIKTGSTGMGSDEQTQVFKQAPTATCPGVFSEYDVSTGNLHTTHRIYYLTADCTGTAFVWDAGGDGIDRQKTEAGVSFMSPNTEGQMWVAPNTQSTIEQVQSVFINNGSGCQPDGDKQSMWLAVQTNTSVSGVALSLGPNYQLSGL